MVDHDGDVVDTRDYCRRVEDHLTRMNGGHLVRIVGPGFELVRGWAADGIPLRIVCRGIDRKVERHHTGASRRPLRIEFCEDDVRAVFEHWRRAVGLTTRGERVAEDPSPDAGTVPAARRPPSLSKHLQRALDRIVRTAGRMDLPEPLRTGLTAVAADVAALRESVHDARGAARDALLPQLQTIDRALMTVVRAGAAAELVDAARRDAVQDLAGYRGRMAAEQWSNAVDASLSQLLRDRLGLPTLEW